MARFRLIGFSSDPIRRHPATLEDREVVYQKAGKKWQLISIQEQPGKTMLRLACSGQG